ncbi:putative Phosphatidylinositol 3 and 4 kinase [Trypanosoma vivax]|uniref:1-phosphatidylinositol 4-kinase n=1 Tax=Trypanosoma vivax (strain Y486) TaxID=1055687 RepID=G0TTZ0_TRYVY|nr:putative phosphatidylinositol 4-kinase [Trypanosoma vivax]KAH8613734.1 putative Phosphatidylinositol 3 and 4 kinase [Trypanosoma vivax]CCC47423.1 putative phosphatidylinositol 4-kinase [Trypanosoma vivax Y486]
MNANMPVTSQVSALIELLLSLATGPHDKTSEFVDRLFSMPLEVLEVIFLQVSHVCITHKDSEAQSLIHFMLRLSGQSLYAALRLAWAVDSVQEVFTAVGLGVRIKELQDRIESFAINRRGITPTDSHGDMTETVMRKELRLKVFNDERAFLNVVTNLSGRLLSYSDRHLRQSELRKALSIINSSLSSQWLIYPFGHSGDPVRWIVRIAVEDCVVFFSRQRAPFLLRCEVIVDDTATMADPTVTKLRLSDGRFKLAADSDQFFDSCSSAEKSGGRELCLSEVGDTSLDSKHFQKVFGGSPEVRMLRLRGKSPFGSHPNWDVASLIVKSGDDLRQEELALQLVEFFNRIWREAGLTCSVFPYRALSVSAESGVIECINDACSIDSIKKQCQLAYLPQFFNEAFGPRGSAGFRKAQRNFVETMAGYSIFTYIMQVKDRHNGNIMIMRDGRLLHIDFGFMLVTSPGGLKFESAPFKLSQELLEVMDGACSASFDYFKVLLFQGMMAVRHRAEEILALVSLMASRNTMSCFGTNPHLAIEQLRSRFRLDLETEADVALYVRELILESVDNWRTRRYDQFQTLQNGIL